ncbi:MAG TPA: SOS response-associated peptidase [Steroidobacteraceae bacterium]|nr:SOS response-associated peptidase [Steroidobacteraceae bacterium]
MCERYVTPQPAQVDHELAPARSWWQFRQSFNVAPTRNVPVIRLHDGSSEGVMMRWGLVPSWAEGDPARASYPTLAGSQLERSSIARTAWLASQRCLLPAAGFYLWQRVPKGYRQPFFVYLEEQPVLAIAGLWDRSVSEDDDVIESCAMLTMAPDEALSQRHGAVPQVPVVLGAQEQQQWLRGTPAQAKALLQAARMPRWASHAVSPRVNSLQHDDAALTGAVTS